jgi:hypothetical protein
MKPKRQIQIKPDMSVETVARLMLERYGRSAGRISRAREDTAISEERSTFWLRVCEEILRINSITETSKEA